MHVEQVTAMVVFSHANTNTNTNANIIGNTNANKNANTNTNTNANANARANANTNVNTKAKTNANANTNAFHVVGVTPMVSFSDSQKTPRGPLTLCIGILTHALCDLGHDYVTVFQVSQ